MGSLRGHSLGFSPPLCLTSLYDDLGQMRTERFLEEPSRQRDLRMLMEAQEGMGDCCVSAQAGGLAPVFPPRTAELVSSHSVPRCAMALVGSPTRWPPAPQPFTCNCSCLMWHRWVWEAAQGPLFHLPWYPVLLPQPVLPWIDGTSVPKLIVSQMPLRTTPIRMFTAGCLWWKMGKLWMPSNIEVVG